MARAAYGRYYMPLSIEFLRRFGPDVPRVTPRVPDVRGRAVERRSTPTATGRSTRIETRDAARKVQRSDAAQRGSADDRLSPGR